MTFSGRFLLSMIQFAVQKGADIQTLLAVAELDFNTLSQEETRVHSKVYKRVIEACVDITKDEFFGLHAGEFMNLSAAGLIGQITQTSATVKEAMDYCCEFANLGCRALPMDIIEGEDQFQLDFVPDPIWKIESKIATKQTIDGVMAFALREFHLLTLQKFYPLAVGFSFEKPDRIEEYERIFKCPLKFDQPITFMQFQKEHLNTKVVTSDYRLLRILVEHAEGLIAAFEQSKNFKDKVRNAIVQMMDPNLPTIQDIAQNMNMSVRTLQRKLDAEQTSFKSILEHLKEEMALNYLSKPDLTIKEIAFLLGYGDTSAFTRGFKNKRGISPSQFRLQNAS